MSACSGQVAPPSLHCIVISASNEQSKWLGGGHYGNENQLL